MTTIVSSKYQIVIPKKVRQQAGVTSSTVLYQWVNRRGNIILSKKPRWQQHAGTRKGIWSSAGDPATLLRVERDRDV